MDSTERSAQRGLSPRGRGCLRWLSILGVMVILVLAGFAWLWYGVSPRVPTGPLRWVRGDEGRLVPVHEAADEGSARFEAQAAKTTANNNFGSSVVVTHSGPVRFACRRMAVLNRSDHLLMARVGQRLADQLKELDYLDQLDYFPAGHGIEPGQQAPDVLIALDLAALSETGHLTGHKLEAKIVVWMGDRPFHSDHFFGGEPRPPLMDFRWNGTLEHRSTTEGFTSSAARYKQPAEDIAKQVAGRLAKQFEEWRKKEEPLPRLPEAFYPAYRQAPALPLGQGCELELAASWHGLLSHNETFWRLRTDRDPAAVLTEIEKRMAGSGWKRRDSSNDPKRPYLRMDRDAAAVEIFSGREGAPGGFFGALPGESDPGPSPGGQELQVHYVDRITRPELDAAIDETLTREPSAEVLGLFADQWNARQRQKALEWLRSHRPGTPRAWLLLAGLHRQRGEAAQARDALLRAQALVYATLGDAGMLAGELRDLARQLGDEKLVERPPEQRLLAELGFVELKPPAAAGPEPAAILPPREIAPDEPVNFFAVAAGGKLMTFSIRVVSPGSAQGGTSHHVAFVEHREGGGRSWGTGGTEYSSNVDGLGMVSFRVVRPRPGERLQLHTEVHRPSAPAASPPARDAPGKEAGRAAPRPEQRGRSSFPR